MNAGYRFIREVENAVAGRAMQADVDVYPIFFAQLDRAVDGSNFLFPNFEQILRVGPEPIIHGQADPVESPILDPAEIVFLEEAVIFVGKIFHPIGICREIFKQVEAIPFGIGKLIGTGGLTRGRRNILVADAGPRRNCAHQ